MSAALRTLAALLLPIASAASGPALISGGTWGPRSMRGATRQRVRLRSYGTHPITAAGYRAGQAATKAYWRRREDADYSRRTGFRKDDYGTLDELISLSAMSSERRAHLMIDFDFEGAARARVRKP